MTTEATPEVPGFGDGYACHIVVKDMAAYRELHDLMSKWARSHGMYIDWEQSLCSYQKEKEPR